MGGDEVSGAGAFCAVGDRRGRGEERAVSGGLRGRFMEILRRAAREGVSDAWRMMDLTPAEIEMALAANRAREMKNLRLLDAAAWLAGRYVAIGINQPRKYPQKPNGVRREIAPMGDMEMKRALLAFCRARGGEECER